MDVFVLQTFMENNVYGGIKFGVRWSNKIQIVKVLKKIIIIIIT